MDEPAIPAKTRKKRSDAGIPRLNAPIEVRYRLKGSSEWTEIGCARRFTSNGFYVFLRPSPKDPYRQERREVAISEVAEITITAAEVEDLPQRPVYDVTAQPPIPEPAGPRFHNARQSAALAMAALEASNTPGSSGPARLDVMPGISFGDSAG